MFAMVDVRAEQQHKITDVWADTRPVRDDLAPYMACMRLGDVVSIQRTHVTSHSSTDRFTVFAQCGQLEIDRFEGVAFITAVKNAGLLKLLHQPRTAACASVEGTSMSYFEWMTSTPLSRELLNSGDEGSWLSHHVEYDPSAER